MTNRYPMDYEDFSKYFKVEDGKLIRLVASAKSKVGKIIGTPNNEGYLKFMHKGKVYSVHRAIYLLTHKECPDCIDHINGNVSDNRIENLRAASNKLNSYNQKIRSSNKTGCKGVHRLKNGGGYQASISYDGKRKFLGVFQEFEDAKDFITLARDMVHGQFANHGVTV